MNPIARIAERVRFPLLLALDYDGTLVEICDRPENAVLSKERKNRLRRTAEAPGITLTVVSGRKMEEILGLLPPGDFFVAGGHGAEIRFSGGNRICLAPPGFSELDPIREKLGEILPLSSRFRIEEKPHSIALHYRGVEENLAGRGIAALLEWYERQPWRKEVAALRMKKVIEFLPRSLGKEGALRRILGRLGGDRFLLFFGDDETDRCAFGYVNTRGISVFVGPEEKRGDASFSLPGPPDVYRCLDAIFARVSKQKL